MKTFDFTLTLSGQDELTDELADALYGGGCDDALLGTVDGRMYLDFGREAETYEEAVASATRDVEATGLVKVIEVRPINEEETKEA